MCADRHFFEVLPSFNGDHHSAVLVHNVDGAKIPAVDLKGFAVLGRRVSLALIERVGFDQATIGNVLLQGSYHFARENVGTVRFAGMQLDGDLSTDCCIDLRIDSQQSIAIEVRSEENLRWLCPRGGKSGCGAEIASGRVARRKGASLGKSSAFNFVCHACPIVDRR
ncbi:MAG: hypothetical protein WCA21_11055 [Terracidiphilus sp.]